jgi:hypothetical protein
LLIITGINPKALQLTIMLLRRYEAKLKRVLSDSDEYPLPGTDIDLELEAALIPEIIASITALGEQWLAEEPTSDTEKSRYDLRQECVYFILDEWIKIGEECQQRIKGYSH